MARPFKDWVLPPAQELLPHDVRGHRRQRDVSDPAVLRPRHGEQKPVQVDVLPRRLEHLLLARAGDHQQRQRRAGTPPRLGVERVHQRLRLLGGRPRPLPDRRAPTGPVRTIRLAVNLLNTLNKLKS
jgi:hypothetical protein